MANKRKKYIWNQSQQEQKNDIDTCRELADFGNKNGNRVHLRQDKIDNGIKLNVQNEILYSVMPLVDKQSKFNVMEQYDSGVYLSRCLLLAHKMKFKFHNDVRLVLRHFKAHFKTLQKQQPGLSRARARYEFIETPVKSIQQCKQQVYFFDFFFFF